MTNLVVLLVIVLIIGFAISKVISEKRKGVTCIGCSDSGKCSSTKTVKKGPFDGPKIEIKELL